MTAEVDKGQAAAIRLGFQVGQVVHELGHGDDVDQDLLTSIEEVTGQEVVGEEDGADDVADVVLLWFREDDGDLIDTLVDALGSIDEGGTVWLLTPKQGRSGHVTAEDIAEAAITAGLSTTRSIAAAQEWQGSRLISPKR
ncbi:DUF3052 domain-containing protein [Nocardiopsis alba]|uniref:DUF3052 domain-containing protein n=1 Tax=Nocardiopsis alba TaxID=53437 RepID=UPI0033E1DF4C